MDLRDDLVAAGNQAAIFGGSAAAHPQLTLGAFDGLRQMRLEPVPSPDLVHRRRRDASLRRYRALAPAGGVLARRFSGRRLSPSDPDMINTHPRS